MQLRTRAMLVALTLLPACQLPREHAPDAGSDAAARSDAHGEDVSSLCMPGTAGCGSTGGHAFHPNDCSTLGESIFLIEGDGTLIRYEPRTGRYLRDIAQGCSGQGGFTLAVGRDAKALSYNTFGRLRRVNMATGVCEVDLAVTYGPGLSSSGGLSTLTYVGREGEPEHLLVMRASARGEGLVLAELDPLTLVMNERVPLDPRIPSLYDIIGSPTGEVWSFMRLSNVQRVIARIDLDTGMLAETYDVSAMGPPVQDQSSGDWSNAVALWGGRFFVWMQAPGEASASLYRFTPPTVATGTGTIDVMQRDTGLRIAGAATSTCAPIL